jgi:Uma2 family endonuclease
MPGDFLRRAPQLTMEQFHAFRDERPKEEKWELIDGVPMMMPPPTVMHVRISRNLETLLNTRLAAKRTGAWRRRQLMSKGTALTFPDIGTVGRLGDIYKFTPLDPFAKAVARV